MIWENDVVVRESCANTMIFIQKSSNLLTTDSFSYIIARKEGKKKRNPSSSPIYFPITLFHIVPLQGEEIFLQFWKNSPIPIHLSKEQRANKITQVIVTKTETLGG